MCILCVCVCVCVCEREREREFLCVFLRVFLRLTHSLPSVPLSPSSLPLLAQDFCEQYHSEQKQFRDEREAEHQARLQALVLSNMTGRQRRRHDNSKDETKQKAKASLFVETTEEMQKITQSYSEVGSRLRNMKGLIDSQRRQQEKLKAKKAKDS